MTTIVPLNTVISMLQRSSQDRPETPVVSESGYSAEPLRKSFPTHDVFVFFLFCFFMETFITNSSKAF